MIAAWRTARIRADALVISSHFAAHAAAMHFDGPSVVYYHTPARMLWRPELELERLPRQVRRTVEMSVLPVLRSLDRQASAGPTTVLANSSAVAARIKTAYGRTAQVIHPPVDVERWRSIPRGEPRHLLWLGRLVTYKRLTTAVEAARLSGLPLLVVGDGPEREAAQRSAPDNVRFLGRVDEVTVREAMSTPARWCSPVRRTSASPRSKRSLRASPVIAYGAGGALDYIECGRNGLLVRDQQPASFAEAMRTAWNHDWNEDEIRASASRFDRQNFRRAMSEVVASTAGRRCVLAGQKR